MCIERRNLVTSLLPDIITTKLSQRLREDSITDSAQYALALLISSSILGSIQSLEKRAYKDFDANPGEGGCQARALELRRIVQLDSVKEECGPLSAVAERIKATVQKYKGKQSKLVQLESCQFFTKEIGDIEISKEMEFLLHSYVSKVMRLPVKTLENGIVITKSDVGRLSMLSKNFDKCVEGVMRQRVLEQNQITLARISREAMRSHGNEIVSLEQREKQLLMEMLSIRNTKQFTEEPRKFLPKEFGCLFYEVKTLLTRLKEEKAVICLQNISNTGIPFRLYFRPKVEGEEFEVLLDEEVKELDKNTLITAFDAVVTVEKEKAKELFMQHGFSEIVLMQSANEAPYNPSSKIEEIKEPEARQEIDNYRRKSKNLENFLILDHIFLMGAIV